VWGQGDGAPSTEEFQGATRRVGPTSTDSPRSNVYSEAPTRRIDAPPSLDSSYRRSLFPQPNVLTPPAPYQPPVSQFQVAAAQKPTSRNVEGLGLPEKWAIVMPYAPFYVGVVASIIELILVPRKRGSGARARCSGTGAAYGNHSHCDVVWGLALIRQLSGGSFFKLAAFIFLIIRWSALERPHTSYRRHSPNSRRGLTNISIRAGTPDDSPLWHCIAVSMGRIRGKQYLQRSGFKKRSLTCMTLRFRADRTEGSTCLEW